MTYKQKRDFLKIRRHFMKILGISFGQKNQRCDIMVKEELFAAKEADAGVPHLRHLGQAVLGERQVQGHLGRR